MTDAQRYVSITEFSEHDVVDGHTELRGAVNSPKSVTAMRKCCITDADLRVRAFEEFALTPAERDQISDEDLSLAFQATRYDEYLRRRKSAIQLVMEVRKQIIREEQSKEVCRQRVAKQLSTLSGESKKSPKKKTQNNSMAAEQESDALPPMNDHKKQITKELLALIQAYHRDDESRRDIIKKEKSRLLEHKKKLAAMQAAENDQKTLALEEVEKKRLEVRERALEHRQKEYDAAVESYFQKVQRMKDRISNAQVVQSENTIAAQKQLQLKAQLNRQLDETLQNIQKRDLLKKQANQVNANKPANSDLVSPLGNQSGLPGGAGSGSPSATGANRLLEDDEKDDIEHAMQLCDALAPSNWRRPTKIVSPSSLNKPSIWPPSRAAGIDVSNSPPRVKVLLSARQISSAQADGRGSKGSTGNTSNNQHTGGDNSAHKNVSVNGGVTLQRGISKEKKNALIKKRENTKRKAEEIAWNQIKEAGRQWEKRNKKNSRSQLQGGESESEEKKKQALKKEIQSEKERQIIKLRYLEQQERRNRELIELAGKKFTKGDQVAETRALKQLMKREENALRDEWRLDQLTRMQRVQKLKEEDLLSSMKEREHRFNHWKEVKLHEETEKKKIQEAYILANQKIKNTLHIKAPREVTSDLQGALQMVYKQADNVEAVLLKGSVAADK